MTGPTGPTGPTGATGPSGVAGILTTKGDIFVAGTGGALSRLPVGLNGQYLVADSNATFGVIWTFITSYSVRLITTNLPSPSQATLQSYYDNVIGSNAPDTVPTEVTAADVGTSGYTIYLGHDVWSYRQNSSGAWIQYGKSSFGADVAKLYTYK